MMVKGFIFFRDGKIPFVIENYRMELFTDDSLLDDFCKEYKHRLTRAHREKQLKMSCQALHNAPPNRT